jgi:hypothetical protein
MQNRPKVHQIYLHLPLQDPPKFTNIDIFGLKIYHLATLVLKTVPSSPKFAYVRLLKKGQREAVTLV